MFVFYKCMVLCSDIFVGLPVTCGECYCILLRTSRVDRGIFVQDENRQRKHCTHTLMLANSALVCMRR